MIDFKFSLLITVYLPVMSCTNIVTVGLMKDTEIALKMTQSTEYHVTYVNLNTYLQFN